MINVLKLFSEEWLFFKVVYYLPYTLIFLFFFIYSAIKYQWNFKLIRIKKCFINSNIKINPSVLKYYSGKIILCYSLWISFVVINIVFLSLMILFLKKYNLKYAYILITIFVDLLFMSIPIALVVQYCIVVKNIKYKNLKIDDSRLLENIIKNDENKSYQVSYKEVNTFVFYEPFFRWTDKTINKKITFYNSKNKYEAYWNAILNFDNLAIIKNNETIKISFGSFYNEFKRAGWIVD